MMIKVLQIFALLDMGGAECRMMDIYRSIDREKFNFDFVTLQQGNQYFEKEISELGGNVFKLQSPREVGIKNHIRELRVIMQKGQYQAVHAHTSYHCGIVMYAAKKENIPVRISHARTNGSIQQSIKTKVYIDFGRALINRYSTNRLAISKESGDFLFGKKQYEVVPNSIDLSKYKSIPLESINCLKKELDIQCNTLTVGHIGRFDQFKNQRFVIDVFNKLLAHIPNSRLILTGEGELKNELELYTKALGINEKITFTGVRSDVPVLMSCFDVLLFPSIVEGLGGVVLEAQAAGIPSVISENVPMTVDVGLGLVKRCSLSAPIEKWISAIKDSIKVINPDFELIEKKFEESGYSLNASMKRYEKIYEG